MKSEKDVMCVLKEKRKTNLLGFKRLYSTCARRYNGVAFKLQMGDVLILIGFVKNRDLITTAHWYTKHLDNICSL